MSWDGEKPLDAETVYTHLLRVKHCRTCGDWLECPYDSRFGWCRPGDCFTESDEGDEECWTA